MAASKKKKEEQTVKESSKGHLNSDDEEAHIQKIETAKAISI
jgi:hypothetical protein